MFRLMKNKVLIIFKAYSCRKKCGDYQFGNLFVYGDKRVQVWTESLDISTQLTCHSSSVEEKKEGDNGLYIGSERGKQRNKGEGN